MRTRIWWWKASLNSFAPAAENRNAARFHLNQWVSDQKRTKLFCSNFAEEVSSEFRAEVLISAIAIYITRFAHRTKHKTVELALQPNLWPKLRDAKLIVFGASTPQRFLAIFVTSVI